MLGYLLMLASALTFIAGVAIIIGTVRVAPTGELCGKCRYRLRGLPETAKKCPECGADLDQLGGRISPELHQINWLRLLAGLVLIILAGCVLPAMAWSSLN